MKFSYPLIKKFVPGLKNKKELVRALSLHAFEAVDSVGDIFEVNLPPNRYSDASHYGIAKEAAAIFGLKCKTLSVEKKKMPKLTQLGIFVDDKKLCPRYTAQYFEGLEIKPSPFWMQKILTDCGLRPINNVVDIMNYIMLEVGQPLHAFDFDKIANTHKYPTNNTNKIREIRNQISGNSRKIVIRRAKPSEKITSIDGVTYKLNPTVLLITDLKKAQAIAGIKGGRGSEVTEKTKRIIVEAANFLPASVYRTSKLLKLTTDASLRFSHGLSPALTALGQCRAKELLGKLTGAKLLGFFDSRPKEHDRRVLKFDTEKFNHFVGSKIDEPVASALLKRLGFKKIKGNEWEVPPYRMDIETHEDMFEEIVRLLGYNKLKVSPPLIALSASESEEIINFKDILRKTLVGLGFSEVYNTTFISNEFLTKMGARENFFEVANPVAEDKRYLRPSFVAGLQKNLEDNFRFYESFRIFEIGKVYRKDLSARERWNLGIAIAAKKGETFLELKGAVYGLLQGLGLTDFFMHDFDVKKPPFLEGLEVESDHKVLGYLGRLREGGSIAELDIELLLQAVEDEKSFEPLPKYPAVMRDVSMILGDDVRIGEIIRVVQQSNQKLIADVDLVDEYIDEKWEKEQSVTLRIVFQAKDRTLTSEEVDKEMGKIAKILEDKFEAQIR